MSVTNDDSRGSGMPPAPSASSNEALRTENEHLKKSVAFLTRELATLRGEMDIVQYRYAEAIQRLAATVEHRDCNAAKHIARMSRYCEMIGRKIGMHGEELDELVTAAPMHDIGKAAVPEAILFKKGKLNTSEFLTVQMHTVTGAKMLAGSEVPVLKRARQIALCHHEHWNGKGYPTGTRGSYTPLAGRIVHICDVFDALTSELAHKDAYPVEFAFDIIENRKETEFDPELVEALQDGLDTAIRIKAEIDSPENFPTYDFTLSGRDSA